MDNFLFSVCSVLYIVKIVGVGTALFFSGPYVVSIGLS